MRRAALVVCLLLSACEKAAPPPAPVGEKAPRGLPPYSAPAGGEAAAPGAPAGGPGARDPHVGLGKSAGDPFALGRGGGDPHAGLGMGGGDPHAGLQIGGGGAHGLDTEAAGAPHGGAGPHGVGGTAPAAPVDPAQILEGTIAPSAALAAQVKPGDIIFLAARAVDPASGQVQRVPLAVARVDVDRLPATFVLTPADAMVPGVPFAGKVVLTARVDRDGEARSRQPGDLEGSLEATIPARGLALVLDKAVE